jgi:homoserine kinase
MNNSFSVRVPASSANLGPGFDALGMALSLYFEMGLVDNGGHPANAQLLDEHHPATVAFRFGGGVGDVWAKSNIPMGRGLGFSGAARVAGVVLAHVQTNGASASLLGEVRSKLLHQSTELEGHPDNVAASLVGGVTASASGEVVRLPLALEPAIIAWVPETQTSTEKSRTTLSPNISLADAVVNIGHTALLLGALASGDTSVLRVATTDRIHQDIRLANAPTSQEALNAALASNAWCAWLSGSGPTVAVMCAKNEAEHIASQLPETGVTKILSIDNDGAVVLPGK